MLVAYWSTCRSTLGWYINRDVSVECRTRYRRIYWLTCRLTHHDQHISRESVNMSTDISVGHQSICRPTVDQYVRRHVDWHIGRGVHKLHTIQNIEVWYSAYTYVFHLESLNLKSWKYLLRLNNWAQLLLTSSSYLWKIKVVFLH